MKAANLLTFTLCVLFTAHAFAQERKEVRVLYDFEEGAELEELRKGAEGTTFDLVQDNGVTRGKNCCRMVFKQGADYGNFFFGGDKIRNWKDFDYIAFDIFQERDEKISFAFELWDALTKGYPTRCTFEPNNVRQGKQTVVIQINRAKRNGKEGRTWEEAEPQDKIAMNAMTKVKFFLTPPKTGGDLVWWVDNIRLLQEDALGGKMKVEVPAGVKAFDFGHPGSLVSGMTPVPAGTAYDDGKGFGVSSGNVENIGRHWPDPLTGDGIIDPAGGTFVFDLKLADGEYWVWLSAGARINPENKNPNFLLKLGDEILADDKGADIYSEKYLYRFMNTQYSERENALWLDFIDRMYPAYEKKIKVAGGKLSIQSANHWLAGLIVMPSEQEAAFKKMTAEIKTERIRTFYSTLNLDPQKKPQKKDTDGAFVAFIPDDTTHFHPATGPSDSERARTAYDLAAAPGQRLTFRLGVTPFENVGKCTLSISTLKGPGEIPPSATRIYFQDYRLRGESVRESALKPSAEASVEKGVSLCWWAWLKIPDDAAPGDYSGTATLTPAGGKAVTLPIKLKVHAIKLEEILPFSFGMYYGPRGGSKVVAEQLKFMREIGFTATCVGSGKVNGINADNTVDASFDPEMWNLVKAAGMGRHPLQYQMANSLGAARTIGRRHLGLGAKIDQQPGIEMENPRQKPLFIDFAKKFAAFIKQTGVPTAVEIVDEPREVPNPWNRNLVHTNLYGDWLKEGGIFPTFVTPMGDKQSGKDYTSLIDHADIVSTHAGKGSEQLMKLTPERKKLLWLYNTGMDRLSWGFYNWRVGSIGRWEWHFCSSDGGPNNGYANDDEWYNPFTGKDGDAPHAPAALPGSMLFKSGFFTCSEGITDSAYIVTLEKAIAANEANAAKSAAVAKAKEFLAGLKTTIPFLPGVKGIASADDGALVGKGLEGDAQKMCETWRRQVAELLVALK
jgi:hypothetical protein